MIRLRRITAPATLIGLTSIAVLAGVACGSNSATTPPQLATATTAYPPGYYPPPGTPGYATAAPGYATAAPPGYPAATPPGYPATAAPGYPTAPPPAYTAPPATATAAPGLPFSIPGFAPPASTGSAASGGSAQPLDPSLASAAVIPLNGLAGSEAPGMAAVAGVLAGNFQQGQSLQQAFTLTAGKCYTIIAVGAGVSQIGLSIVAQASLPIPGLSPVLQQDSGPSNDATLGGASKGGCWHWQYPFNVPANWTVTASGGAGLIAAQIFSK